MAELTNIHAAILALQADLPTIEKTQTADTGKYKYQYAGLNEVSDALFGKLNDLGLIWVTMPTREDGANVLAYTLEHTSGGSFSGSYPLPANATGQEMGAAITYARRYALCAVTGVAPGGDDNDAKQASKVKATVPDATLTEWTDVLNAAETVVEIELAWKSIAQLGLAKEPALVRAGADRKKILEAKGR